MHSIAYHSRIFLVEDTLESDKSLLLLLLFIHAGIFLFFFFLFFELA